MEQQKVLWIIFSVTLLVLVIILAIFWLLPDGAEILVTENNGQSNENTAFFLDPTEFLQGSEEYPSLETDPEADTPETTDYIIGETEEAGDAGNGSSPSVVEAESAGEVETYVRQVVSSRSTEVSTGSEPETAVSVAGNGNIQTSTVVKEPEKVRVLEYWIQVGSYTSKFRSEQSKSALEEKGIYCRITSKSIDGKDYFRVRTGPYTNSNEADKFLSLVKNVSGFEGSYISEVYVERTAN